MFSAARRPTLPFRVSDNLLLSQCSAPQSSLLCGFFMKIISAKVIVTCPGRNFVTLKIETDQGLYGVGDATLNGREKAVVSCLEDYMIPALIGRDPQRIEDIWQYFYRGVYWR